MSAKAKHCPLRAAYVAATGHEPPVPPDEYLWQWEYRGTPEQREELRSWLFGTVDQPEAEPLFAV